MQYNVININQCNLLSANGVYYGLEIQYHHVASGGLKTCGIRSVLYVCVSSQAKE